ncbi:MAG TPA: acetate--CoA ligase family protein, partial [Acidimicrobiales bacterium]|nr:acetate--CoA ligase family protein [Acidimicrobiales bacterium]
RGRDRPVVASFLGAAEARRALAEAPRPVPCFAYPENAVRALAHSARYASWRARPEEPLPVLEGVDANEARRLVSEGTPGAPAWLTGAPAMGVLGAYGIPTLPTRAAGDEEAAATEAARLGFPVALKAAGPALVHKSEHGGVRLGLADARAVVAAYRDMAASLGASMEGATVQPMVAGGVETIVGFVQDPSFGPQVVFGLGGTAVEILGDSVTRLAPLTATNAREMVLGLRAAPLFRGYRGSPPVDLDALVDVVLRMSALAEDLPEIAEADCNPVIAGPTGAVVVDARLRVAADAVAAPEGPRHLR